MDPWLEVQMSDDEREYNAKTETPNIDRCPKCGEYLHDEMGHMCPETPSAPDLSRIPVTMEEASRQISQYMREAATLRQRIEEMEAELARVREALEWYGWHKVEEGIKCCAYYDGKPCDCGFEAALRKGH